MYALRWKPDSSGLCGCLWQGVYERLIEKAGLAYGRKDRIPSEARVVGELVFEKGPETRRIPLYEWQRTVPGGRAREPKSGFRLSAETGVEFGLHHSRDRDSLVSMVRATLEADYNLVAQEDWDAEDIDPARMSVAPLGNRGLQLVLEIDKTRFTTDEPIRVQLKVANLDSTTCLLESILPYRNITNPPRIEFCNEAGEQATLKFGAGIVEELRNGNTTFVDPGKAVVLIDADLRQLQADALSRPEPDGGRQRPGAKTPENWLDEGIYRVSGQWYSELLGGGQTAQIEFEITAALPSDDR